MEAALETGDATTTARLFLRATLWTLLIPSLFCFPLDIIHLAPVPFSPNNPDRMDIFFPPPQRRFHMRHLIMNKLENNLCHIKLYCFRFAIFMRPSWSLFDVFCSQSGAPVAPVDWQSYQNPQKLYWTSDRWVSKQNAGLLILEKWSNCF